MHAVFCPAYSVLLERQSWLQHRLRIIRSSSFFFSVRGSESRFRKGTYTYFFFFMPFPLGCTAGCIAGSAYGAAPFDGSSVDIPVNPCIRHRARSRDKPSNACL